MPVVVVPGFADQATKGRVVAQAGPGTVVTRPRGADSRRLAGPADTPAIHDAAAAVLAERTYRPAARELAAELSAPPPTAEVLAGLTK